MCAREMQTALVPGRVVQELRELQDLTGTSAGAQRVCWTETWARARAWMRDKLSALPVTVEVDEAGNQWATLPGQLSHALLIGGHIDSVPNGGWLDGSLNLVAGLEVLRRIASEGTPPVTVRLVDWADEEGARFGRSLLGSSAFSGTLEVDEVRTLGDRDGISLPEALARYGVDLERMKEAHRQVENAAAYLELHIEQGPVLEAEGLPVGVVTAINGFSRLRATLNGVAGHAGTVPMHLRRDALAAAAECVLAVERIAKSDAELVGTVGRIEAKPGAINVIPGEVQFTIDVRAPRDELRAQAVRDVVTAVETIAAQRKVGCKVETLQELGVAKCAPWLMQQFERAIAADGIRVRKLPSGAGHDGMAMKTLTDIAMLFVRCKAGISHNPAESITEADAAVGATTLLRFIEDFELPA
jgi:hydantoinase/carbamoylase family amidase